MQKMRCVVVAGAPIGNYEAVKSYLREDDFLIYCDCGLRHMEALGRKADLIIGDFDSYTRPDSDAEIITLPRAKDDTDSIYALREGLRRGFDDFLILGAVGARFDHSMANVSALLWLDSLGKNAQIVDDYSEMQIVGAEPIRIPDTYPYFSLLNISGTAEGVSISNAKFPLSNGSISCEYQYAVSNEVLPGTCAEVSVQNGKLLLLKDRI